VREQVRSGLSVCIITLNEEDNLPRCLRSVCDLAEQIVVVDSLSRDGTRKIAAEAGAEVYVKKFLGYVTQKQFALEKARCEWVLSLDADEWLDEQARENVKMVLKNPPVEGIEGFQLRREAFYLGKWVRHGVFSSDWKTRLFRRGKARWVGSYVHEGLHVSGKTKRLGGRLLHYPARNLSNQVATFDHWTDLILKREEKVSCARALFGMILEPPLVFLHRFFIQMGFLEGIPGFISCFMLSFYFFLRYAKIWEKNKSGCHG
jgi:glycosyltransferase involved in cell wall biosynthesis